MHQFGPLNFAVQYTTAISKLYEASGYVPPRGGNRKNRLERRNIPLTECVLKAQECSQLLEAMQNEAGQRSPGRTSFEGPDGMPYTGTIECTKFTIDNWKTLIDRVERIQPGSPQNIYSPSITNEKYVEHSFGFVKKKGQGHNQKNISFPSADIP